MTIPFRSVSDDQDGGRSSSARGRVLVTGGAGFVGSHLVEELLRRGEEVTVLDDLSSGTLGNLAGARRHASLSVRIAPVEDADALVECMRGVDRVFHLAAAVGVRRVVDHTSDVLERNGRCSRALLRAAAEAGSRVLVASSSEVYGKRTDPPFREEDDLRLGASERSRWSYAVGKLLDEHLALALHREGRLTAIVARLFNTIGPRQNGRHGMVVPRLARRALAGEPLTVYGDGRQTRCFCDVDDVVRCLVELMAHPGAAGRVFNVGSTDEVSILHLARRLIELASSDSVVETIPYGEAYGPGFEDMRRRVPDPSRVRELLDWTPERPLDESLRRVLEWCAANAGSGRGDRDPGSGESERSRSLAG